MYNKFTSSFMSAVLGRIDIVNSNIVNATYGKRYANITFKNPMQAAFYVSTLDKSKEAVIVPIGTGYAIYVSR